MDEDFATELLKLIAGTLYFTASLQAAREMYGKSYFELGIGEKQAVDDAVLRSAFGNAQALTPEMIRAKGSQQPPGFDIPQRSPRT